MQGRLFCFCPRILQSKAKLNKIQKNKTKNSCIEMLGTRPLSTPAHNAIKPANRSLNQTPVFQRRRSNSTSNCTIEKRHCFRPSDRFDPVKRQFLVELGKKFWCRPPVRNLCPIKTTKNKKKIHSVAAYFEISEKKTHQSQ